MQRIHAAIVWSGGKTMWQADIAEADRKAAIEREAHRAALDSDAYAEGEEILFDDSEY